MIPTISLETRPRTGGKKGLGFGPRSHCCQELRDIERAFEILDADGAGILEDCLVGQSFIRGSLAASPPVIGHSSSHLERPIHAIPQKHQ